ncbi:hypothetical protein BJ170DRAFT_300338 [Xylariales sp. AK1849]|nr:hypothetical protein BJ170DRAFT_300338 [Xylariales sp. AK1849]
MRPTAKSRGAFYCFGLLLSCLRGRKTRGDTNGCLGMSVVVMWLVYENGAGNDGMRMMVLNSVECWVGWDGREYRWRGEGGKFGRQVQVRRDDSRKARVRVTWRQVGSAGSGSALLSSSSRMCCATVGQSTPNKTSKMQKERCGQIKGMDAWMPDSVQYLPTYLPSRMASILYKC